MSPALLQPAIVAVTQDTMCSHVPGRIRTCRGSAEMTEDKTYSHIPSETEHVLVVER